MASWVLLALALLFLVLTLNSFSPVRRNRILFLPSFAASWLVNELASIYLFTMVAITVAFVWFGDVQRSLEGLIGLGLMLVTWGLLWVIHLRAVRASEVVEEALGEMVADQPSPRRARRSRYRKIRNVTFTEVAGRELRLDITLPTEELAPGELRPAVLQIHGGGWVIGDKREQGLPLLRRLASNGWVGFNANYRLSPGATWPDHLVDCKRALAWIRENAATYGVDPDFVAVTGGSAGGHLTAMVALTADDPSLAPGFEHADLSVQAAVPFYGVYDFTNRLASQSDQMRRFVLEPLVMKALLADEPEKFHAASPMDRVHPGAPPMLVVHGDKDTLTPVEDARHFVDVLDGVSQREVLYAELPGAQHAFEIFSSPRARRTLDGVVRFLGECHRRYVAERLAQPAKEAPVVDGQPANVA